MRVLPSRLIAPGATALALLLVCTPDAVRGLAAQATPDSAAAVTLLGRDTLAVERWVRTGNVITAEAVVRTPRTTYRQYRLELDPQGNMTRFEERLFEGADLERPVRTETLEFRDGGWVRSTLRGDSVREARIEGDRRLLPFIDLVHWPYELVLERAVRDGVAEQPLLSGSRVSSFPLTREGSGRVVVRHPSRGPSVATTDAAGRLLAFDASQTTRKVQVSRVPWLDTGSYARRWAAADQAGRGIGELSGRGEEDEQVGPARVQVDYGTPTKRGREIFGVVVPYDKVWRTGANRATHFSTDHTLVFGDAVSGTLTVPAGEYTLFSRLTADGGELIINRQTGQSGTAHDPARDLGRVRLHRRASPETVERFTIDVVPTGPSAGELRLVWDRSIFAAPFRVEGESGAAGTPEAEARAAAEAWVALVDAGQYRESWAGAVNQPAGFTIR